VSRLSAYLLERGYTRDAAAWLRRALPAADRPLPRAVLLLNLAEAEAWRGGYDEVLSLCDAVLAEGMTADWLENVYPVSIAADALRLGGMVRFIRGDLAGARDWFERSLDDARRVGYRDGEALALEHLGRLLLESGEVERARQCAEEALAIAVAAGRELLGARVRRTCAAIAVADDDPARALEHLADTGRLAEASGDATLGVACDFTRAILARRQGDRRLAAELLVATLRHCRRREDDFDIAIALEELAQLAAAGGQAETAVRLYGAAAAIRGRLSVPEVPRSPGNRADYERRLGELRALVGAAWYRCLWSAGMRMSPDEVIAEAEALARDSGGG
jgi:tetratricopeptide (TPR) repeat protein